MKKELKTGAMVTLVAILIAFVVAFNTYRGASTPSRLAGAGVCRRWVQERERVCAGVVMSAPIAPSSCTHRLHTPLRVHPSRCHETANRPSIQTAARLLS